MHCINHCILCREYDAKNTMHYILCNAFYSVHTINLYMSYSICHLSLFLGILTSFKTCWHWQTDWLATWWHNNWNGRVDLGMYGEAAFLKMIVQGPDEKEISFQKLFTKFIYFSKQFMQYKFWNCLRCFLQNKINYLSNNCIFHHSNGSLVIFEL